MPIIEHNRLVRAAGADKLIAKPFAGGLNCDRERWR